VYSKSVERAFPGCIIFAVDQSFSMTDSFAGSPKSKIDLVSTAINRFIADLISNCEKGEDKPRHYFDVAVIGYTTDKSGVPIVGPVFQGALSGRDLVSVVDLYENPLEVERRKKQQDDGAGGLIEVEVNFPVWYRPPAKEHMAGTAMCTALQRCQQIAQDWAMRCPGSFPPVVIHLTDGESTDGNPEPYADALKSVATQDGNLLLFNCHLSSSTADPVMFPNSEQILADDYAKSLFRMSSALPDKMLQMAEVKGLSASPGAKGMVFNADSTKMLLLISVGTVVAAPDNLILR
jgi:hypothetical protein